MNMEKELDDILEILENQKRRALKSSNAAPEYSYGQIGSLKISIELIKDLKKRWIERNKLTLAEETEKGITEIQSNLDELIFP